jgi:GT2 family glycosyltransferase
MSGAGIPITPAPRLAVVVLSYRDESTILAALASLASQDADLEVVVSHSGGGPTPGLVAAARPDVRVVQAAARRLPGAARNAGIAATTAPYVAFLAGDCTAEPGWAAARLARHDAGERAVACAMAPPAGPAAAVASYLLQHWSRMPHRTPRETQRFGVSYAREVLEALGGFREDVGIAEDAELNARLLAMGVTIAWAPEVRIGHAYPQTLGELTADALARSRRRAAVGSRIGRRVALAGRALAAGAAGLATALSPGTPLPRRRVVAALAHLAAGAFAGAAGALAGGPPEPGALAEQHFHRFARAHARARDISPRRG